MLDSHTQSTCKQLAVSTSAREAELCTCQPPICLIFACRRGATGCFGQVSHRLRLLRFQLPACCRLFRKPARASRRKWRCSLCRGLDAKSTHSRLGVHHAGCLGLLWAVSRKARCDECAALKVHDRGVPGAEAPQIRTRPAGVGTIGVRAHF